MSKIEKYGLIAGRVLLALIFVVGAIGKILNFEGTQAYMELHGMALTATFLLAAIAIELLGGVSLLVGIGTRWSAPVLAAYLVPVTLVFHAFWAVGAAEQQTQMIQFLKNLAVIGGLLHVAAYSRRGEHEPVARAKGAHREHPSRSLAENA